MFVADVRRTFLCVSVEARVSPGSCRRSCSEGGTWRSCQEVTALRVDEARGTAPLVTPKLRRCKLSSSSVSTVALDDLSGSDSCSDDELRDSQVPKTVNFAEEFERQGGMAADHATTLMLRSLPPRLGQKTLMAELDRLGFEGAYNFLYVPLNLRTMTNMGYAFVNFVDSDTASGLRVVLANKVQKRNSKLGKQICASVAHLQGLEANMKHYENSAVSQSRFKQRRPVVLSLV